MILGRIDQRWLALGAAALVVPAVAQAAPASVRASEAGGAARVEIRWPAGENAPPATASLAGSVLSVRFDAPVEADPAPAVAGAPGAIALARRDGDGRTLRFVLRRGFTAALTREAGAVIVALTPAAPPSAPAPTADKPAPAAAAKVAVSVGERPDFTRLAFHFPGGATVTPLQKSQSLDLRFSRPGDIDIAPLNVTPPKLMTSARVVSRPGERLSLALGLQPGVRQRHFVDGPRIIVDLMPGLAPVQATKPTLTPPTATTTSVGSAGIGRVSLVEEVSATRISVRWSSPVRAAAFRRGEALWIAFDQTGGLDASGVAKVGRRHRDIAVFKGDGVSALRIAASAEMLLTASAEGAIWTFTMAERAQRPPKVAALARGSGGAGGARLIATFGREGVVRWIDDPVVGDRFAAAMLEGPVIGVDQRLSTLEAAVLPAAHGAAVEARADGVAAAFENGALVVSRGAGGLLAGRAVAPGAEQDAIPVGEGEYGDALLQLGHWGKGRGVGGATDARPIDVIADLERRAAAEGFEPGAPAVARMALARYLLAHELAPETLGALRAAAVNQPQFQSDPEYRLMRAAANLMMGRLKDAQKDLSASGLQDDPSAALWRGYAAALSENWVEARRNLEAGREALPTQPRSWRARFNLVAGEAALRTGDLPTAQVAIIAAKAEASTADLRAQAQVLEARLAQARGDLPAALKMFDELAKARDEASAVRAGLEAVRIRRELGEAKPAEAIDALEALRFRWRGDALELETIQTLGHVYADLGRWREGLTVMRAAVMRFPDHPAARQLRMDMAGLFETLFLDGGAKTMEPIQALGLYYEFKDLTPFGANGDRMVRQLAARLAEMDLLDRAAELLQHQVDNRLEGLGQAQIAVDLAALYLQDGKPEQAVAAINATRQPSLPSALVAERRLMEANALLRMGRFDHALELVEKDRTPEAQRLRADAAWRQRDWPAASAALKPLLPPPGPSPLEEGDRAVALRAAIAAALAEDEAGLAALSRTLGPRMKGTPDEAAFEVVTSSPEAGDARLLQTARAVARTDLMDRFLARVRERMKTGEEAAPAPAAAAAAPSTGAAG